MTRLLILHANNKTTKHAQQKKQPAMIIVEFIRPTERDKVTTKKATAQQNYTSNDKKYLTRQK